MIDLFEGNSANDVWLKAYKRLVNDSHKSQGSRLGATHEILHANFHILDPRQRWILSRMPAINPAFAIAEAIWILSGDNKSKFINYWNPRLPLFAGTGATYYGAYGHRIEKQFGFSQLERAYKILLNDKTSRQVVIQIWDARYDMPCECGSPRDADIPCNICSLLKVRNERLEWLQIMRSNDIYLGTPHNFIQYTTIQEVLAGWLNLEIGTYYQISDSLHVYEENLEIMHADNDVAIPHNNDIISLPKKDYDQQFPILLNNTHKLTDDTLTKHEFNNIINCECLTQGFKNLLLICAADCARRHKWINEMTAAKSLCNNKLLLLAFNRWESRKRKAQ